MQCHDGVMACSQDRHQDGMSVRRISYKNRIALAAAGLGSRAAGGAALFLSGNGAGAAALVCGGRNMRAPGPDGPVAIPHLDGRK